VLPGGTLRIDRHESMIADHALRAPDREGRAPDREGRAPDQALDPALDPDGDIAHPLWFVIASLRGMGITVDELGDLAARRPGDTLLLGSVTVTHDRPLLTGAVYQTKAEVGSVARHRTRAGRTLDSVLVTVRVEDGSGQRYGTVTSTYLFMREDG
jgi:hypothetical protein